MKERAVQVLNFALIILILSVIRNFYANDCIFDFHKCAQRRSGGPLIIIEGRGEQACANAIAAAARRTKNNKKNNLNNNAVIKRNEEQIVSNGGISKPPPCHFFCDETIAPVCDSQSRTHKNRCKFDLTACRLNSRLGIVSALHIVKEGPCRIEENNFSKFPCANSVRLAPPSRGISFNNINTGNSRIANTKRKLPSSFESSFNPERSMFNEQQHQLDLPPKQMFNDQVQKHQPQQSQCDMCRDEGPFDQIVPVCDNTNRTHRSVCLFAQWNCERRLRGEEENVFVHVGECNYEEECPSKCSHHLRPVCDSNGITHPNLCAYKLYRCLQRKSGIRSTGWLVSLRECASTSIPSHNHNNSNNKNTIISSQRPKQPLTSIECPVEPNCDDEVEEAKMQQICDSDGRIHKSTCLFAHAHCLAAKTGKALRIIECPQILNTSVATTTIPSPSQQKQISTKILPKISANFASLPPPLTTKTLSLNNQNKEKQKLLDCERRWNDCGDSPKDAYCGSDLQTYRNFCAIQKAQCLDNQIEILFKGECERCLANPCLSKRNTDKNGEDNDLLYVCDQGGETKSKCEFEVLRCIYEIKFGYNITAAYQGKCCPSIESCTGGPETQPICDSNNARHSNWCSFEVAKCRSIKIHHKPLEERECNNNTERRKENIEEREEVFRRF
uniref:Kazal-like domain-containing protein n=1 Tax=Meloidogyne hapla TaxID=6305 RepID=A0A1I8BX43_MELHA